MMSMTDADAPDAAAMAPPSCSDALRGCTCFIDITNAGGLNATPVFTKRVLALGAAVVERLSSKVTHVVFKGTTDALRALHDRLARLPANGTGARHVVSVTWVAACTDAFARVDETPHEQARPADTLASLVKSPTYHRGGGSNSSKKRKAMEPLPTQRYAVDLDDPAFSSSQMLAQLRSPDLGTQSPAAALHLDSMQLAALVRTEAAPSTRAGTRKKSRLGGMGDASQLEKCTTVARPKSAPAVVGGVSAGDAEPVDLFSPLRPSAALQRALREAATARAQPEEEAEEKQQSAVVVIEEASPARVPLAPIAPSDVNLIPEPAVMLELPPACDEDDALPAADVAVVEQAPPVLAFIPRGMLAVTCASPELSDVVAAAAKQLRMRLCPFASATVTHLVLGEPKRTLKVLHAIARGAWLLTPAWVYASVEAGQWQKEETFEDETFPGARKSRVAHRDAAFKGLLGAMKLAVHEPRRTGPPASELRALAIAAGATLVKKGPCNVVIVASGDKTGATAAGIAHKGATIVTEQWMMDALAAYELPSKTQDYQP